MLYGLVRLVIWGCIFAGAYYWIVKKSKIIKKKRVVVISLVLCLILGTFSSLIRVENLFFSFDSPEDVLWYYLGGKVDDVVYGNESSMVIYTNIRGSTTSYLIVPRSPNGYKIPGIFPFRSILRKTNDIADIAWFDIISVIGTDDYYIYGRIFPEGETVIITDRNNTVRHIVDRIGDSDIYSVRFFGYIESFTYDYYLLINGEKVDMH